MADESGEVAVKAFGVIPFFFFDLIARVAPGLLLLFGLDHVSGRQIIPSIFYVMLPNDKLRESTPAWLLLMLVTGYILGHAISPLVKRFDTVSDETWKEYDKLRAMHPALTPIAMRIRAEYVMYGGFAVALSIVVGAAALDQIQILWTHRSCLSQWWAAATHDAPFESTVVLLSALLGIWLMLRRNEQTMRTFEKNVQNLHESTGLSGPGAMPDAQEGPASQRMMQPGNEQSPAKPDPLEEKST